MTRLMHLCGISMLFAVTSSLAAPAARAAEPVAEAKSRYATLDGARVHYKSLGDGKDAVVFVHGWGGDMSVWRHQVPDLVGKARLVFVDLPGHGGSDKPKLAYTMDHMARAVGAVLTDAKVEQAVLVGHSMGTVVVRQLYRQQPKVVKGLVFVDGALRLWGPPEEFETFVAPIRGPDYKQALEKMFDGMTALTPADRRAAIKAIVIATPQFVLVSAMESLGKPELYKPDPITVPVLAVHAKSPFWTPDYEKFVKQMAARMDYQVIDGAGHFLMVDKPELFNPMLVFFLRGQGLIPPAAPSK